MSDLKEDELQIERLVKKYEITTFIETGCFEGDTLKFAASLNLKTYSCDINADYANKCRTLVPSATIYTGDSFEFLYIFLPLIKEKSWFWLDAHYPHMYARPKLFTMKNYFPLFEELNLIKSLKPNFEYDLIVCDDIGNIDAIDNPLCDAKSLPPEAIPAKGHLLQEYKDIFKETHDCQVLTKGCGIMIFTPKEVII